MHLIAAPSNLGLSPPEPGREPGTWRAPQALIDAGLLRAVKARSFSELPRPRYCADAQPGSRLRNGPAIRAFNLELAEQVQKVQRQGDFALVIGGDCSILLGALAGVRRAGPVALVHIDGHSDFRHPGNYDPQSTLGAVAGMDLALATGRGEALCSQWPGIIGPLVEERHVVQLGERENRDPDFDWPDVNDTAIKRIDVFEALAIGPQVVLERIGQTLDQANHDFWVHLDIDVLDAAVMPAVDSPGSPGISPGDLVTILSTLVAMSRCCGMSLTVFDPDLDPQGRYARLIVEILAQLPFRQGQ